MGQPRFRLKGVLIVLHSTQFPEIYYIKVLHYIYLTLWREMFPQSYAFATSLI